jgi:hypothetical protein
MAAESPSDREALWERFESYTGVDRWFREELAVGLGAAYEANIEYLVFSKAEIPEEAFREAFIEGAEWTIMRGRGRFGDNPSKRNELENTVWKIFGSEEQVAFMLDRFHRGKFRYSPIGGFSEICLVGDGEAFKFSKPEQQAA